MLIIVEGKIINPREVSSIDVVENYTFFVNIIMNNGSKITIQEFNENTDAKAYSRTLMNTINSNIMEG